MTDMPNDAWYSCLTSCQTAVPCGQGMHTVRWDAGALVLPTHADAEAELVLAALGGEKAGCIELTETWGRHTTDLSVLAIGPRGVSDEINVSWDDVKQAVQAGQGGGPAARGLMRLASTQGSTSAAARRRQAQQEIEHAGRRRTDLLSLLALGYEFQVRLAGQVAAAHADRLDERVRPALTAAITGRLAPVAEQWLGIDPGQVEVSLHTGPGWGTTELTGRGEERRLRVSLPAWWLARVWACGLPLVGGHLVVAVDRAGWPDARVLGVRAPGAEPVPLNVHASEAPGGRADAGDAPHWER
jgi:hypothetical protein